MRGSLLTFAFVESGVRGSLMPFALPDAGKRSFPTPLALLDTGNVFVRGFSVISRIHKCMPTWLILPVVVPKAFE